MEADRIRNIRHNDIGVNVTPGNEDIASPMPAHVVTHIDNITGAAGPTEAHRRQWTPYLITGGGTSGLIADIATEVSDDGPGCIYPDIRLQSFVPGVAFVSERERKNPGEEHLPKRLSIDKKAQWLQHQSNFPVHTVIGYMMPCGERLTQAIEKDPGRRHDLREYQRLMLRIENMLHMNIIEQPNNGFSIQWDRAGGLLYKLTEQLRNDIDDAKSEFRKSELTVKLRRIEADFKKWQAEWKRGRAHYDRLVAEGIGPQEVISQMIANRAATGDPCCAALAQDKTKQQG